MFTYYLSSTMNDSLISFLLFLPIFKSFYDVILKGCKLYIVNFILAMSSNENDAKAKYVLPSGFATSGVELKSLQQKLLQQYYHNQSGLNHFANLESKSQGSKHLPSYNENALEKDKYLRQYDSEAKLANQNRKNSLSNDLLAQMQYKNMKKQYERFQTLEEQSKLIRNTTRFDSLQRQKLKQFNTKYKMEAQQDLKIKQNQRIKNLQEQRMEKQLQRNRLSQVGITRSQSVGNLPRYQSYSNPTKQYYYEIEQAMRTRNSSNANNPQALKRNSSFKITHNEDRVLRNDNMYALSLKQHYNKQNTMLESLRQKQMSQKQDLRQVLLSQIKQKEQAKLQNRKSYESPYTTKDYRFVHHPINNPVDFRHAHDNHYVLGELKSFEK